MVEWRKIGECIVSLKTGLNPRKNFVLNSEGSTNYYITVRELNYWKINPSDKTDKVDDNAIKIINNRSNLEEGDVLFSGTGTIGRTALVNETPKNWNIKEGVYTIKPKKDVLNSKFLIELFHSYYLMNKIVEFTVGDPIRSVPMKNLLQIQIPVPPLSEQQRIVDTLDMFTASIDNLKEQIAQRRKQYEYYRDQLLDLEGKEGVEMKYISQVAKSYTGLTYKPDNVSDTGILVLRSSNIGDDTLVFQDNVYVHMNVPERALVRENDLLICVRNGSKRLVGKAAMITKEAEGMAFGAFMTILRSIDINSKYLFYVWHSTKVKKQYKGDEAMPIAQITAKDFQKIVIPVPSLSEQQRIVDILDQFEASIQNLETQLKLRKKQYEYYRDKLLTFE